MNRPYWRVKQYCSTMRCTFFVEGAIIDPWFSELPDPPIPGSVVNCNGVKWTVIETWRTSPSHNTAEECWIALSASDNGQGHNSEGNNPHSTDGRPAASRVEHFDLRHE